MPPVYPTPPPQDDPGKSSLVENLEERGARWAVNKYVAPYLVHWKTSIAGIAVIINCLYDVANGGAFDLKQFLAGVGLVLAKDAVVRALPVK
jgi:hypothetical protein